MNTTTYFDAVEKLWTGAKINGDTDEKLSRAEIRHRSICFARNLRKFGCTPEKRIATIARNHHHLTPLLISSMCIGSPLCPLDVLGDENAKILQRLDPAYIFCDADVLPAAQKIVNDAGMKAQFFTVNENVDGYDSIESLLVDDGTEQDFICTEIADIYSHVAVISCSSGSTGVSKSICISHGVFFQTFLGEKNPYQLVSLCFSSMYWFSGLWAVLLPVFSGSRVFTSQPFSTEKFFDLVEKYKVQVFAGAPCHVQAALKSERCKTSDLSSLAIMFPIGSAAPPSLIYKIKETCPRCIVLTAYGITETGGVVTVTLPNELLEHPATVGHLVRGSTVKIINEQTGERCGINEDGEIFIKSSIPALGYFRDEKANLGAFDEDGYFITGDIGYFDEAGRLYISGRRKEMFKVRNFGVWPSELEDVILKHPGVRHACVINVYEEDIVSDLACGVIVPTGNPQITEEEVKKIISDQFTSFKHLEAGVFFVDEFTMTPSGKILRRKVKEIAQKLYDARKQATKSC